MSEKSILEQALLQVQTLEEAVKANAKGILASTMKQELSDLLKESMEEADDEIETEVEEQVDDVEADEEDEQDIDSEDEDVDTDLDNEPATDVDGEEEEEEFGGEFGAEDAEDEDVDSDDSVLDMTGASEEEVLKVFKSMKPEDGIVVKKDGDAIKLNDGDDDYIIQLGDESGEEESEMMESHNDEFNHDTDYENIDFDDEDEFEDEDEDVIYEIELDGEEEEEIEEEEEFEGDVDEAANTIGFGKRGPKQKKMFKAGRHEMNEEISKLKKQNAEYKKALVLFKDKLNEVAVFNANLAYATRLFTESSTTKQEKLNILKRFDTVSTLSESKNLYNALKTELDTKKPISESVAAKINSTPSTSSTQVLSEAKAYENPQFKRMKDLMSKIK
jgi:hypothetical protein